MNYHQYELLKYEWIAKHPEATSAQYSKAMQDIARKLSI